MIRFVVVDYNAIPSGWTNTEKRNSRNRIDTTVGRGQSGDRTELKTHHRKDVLTTYDEQGDITQTASKALYSIDWNGTGDDLITAMVADIADELQKTVQAVTQKVQFTIIGNEQDARDYIAANAATWGEA